MKAVKLSLAAALVASSAFAIENVKVDGQLKLWYQTSDKVTGTTTDTDLLNQQGATGNLFAKIKATGDLTKKVGFGVATYMLSSAGLENNLVKDVASGQASGTETNGLGQNPYWLGEAYFNYKAGNSVVQIGRQTLDTPLAYTETWNAAPNTFEAMVLLNNDLPKTTLVGAFVSRGNGTTDILSTNAKTVTGTGLFGTYGSATGGDAKGAYALGAVTTALDNVTAQGWYYDITDDAKATWLQADAKLPMNMGLGVQYANLEAAGAIKDAILATATTDYKTTAYAVQLSTEVAGVNLAAAYSDVSKGTLIAGNTATGGKKSKIYTASIMSDGTLAAQPDVKSYKLSASTKISDFALGASYSGHEVGDNNNGYVVGSANSYTLTSRPAAGKTYDVNEIDLSVSTKVDDINLAVYYVKQQNKNNAIDVEAVRVIASINF